MRTRASKSLWTGIFLLLAFPAMAEGLISDCDNLSRSASIEVYTSSQTADACRHVTRFLEGLTEDKLKDFETASYLIAKKDCGETNQLETTDRLVEIIRLRGQYNKPDRWKPTLEVVWGICSGLKGAVSPRDLVVFLKSAGPAATTLSDDAIFAMAGYIKGMRQRGN